MIFIFSSSFDLSTDFVIDWLNYYNYPFFRFDSESIFKHNIKIDLADQTIYVGNRKLHVDEINAVWFRKMWIINNYDIYKQPKSVFMLRLFLYNEQQAVFRTMYQLFDKKEWLTNPKYVNLNKCSVLLEAYNVGLYVPKTFIINSKNDAMRSARENKYIIKSSYEPFSLFDEGIYTMFTKSLNEGLINGSELPDIFSPSLVQEKIEKEYEIRTFFIKEECYSMAIFSQANNRTEEDFRNVDWDNPNRSVPYRLPLDIECKVKKLMRKIGLNCGSIDFIKGTDNKYYFLEVNPVGQYGMVDIPCNYNLNKKIALTLMEMDQI